MKTALLIEDNEDNMILISRLLGNAGYRTRWADTGLKGIEMASGHPPDFIILDIQLPDINGIEVMKRLRQELGGGVPIIVMTSHAMAGDRERFLAQGCNEYIEKPIDPEIVIDQIRQVVGEPIA